MSASYNTHCLTNLFLTKLVSYNVFRRKLDTWLDMHRFIYNPVSRPGIPRNTKNPEREDWQILKMRDPPPKGVKAFNYQQSLLTNIKKNDADLSDDMKLHTGRPVRLKNKPIPQYEDSDMSPVSYRAPKEKAKVQKLRATKRPESEESLPVVPLKLSAQADETCGVVKRSFR